MHEQCRDLGFGPEIPKPNTQQTWILVGLRIVGPITIIENGLPVLGLN